MGHPPTKEMLNELIVFLFSAEYSKYLNLSGTVEGGGQGNLNVNNVERFVIPLPPLNEQKEIIDYLGRKTRKIDGLVGKVQEVITKLKEYRSVIITSAVTGKIRVTEA